MTFAELESRLLALETEMTRLKDRLGESPNPRAPWWSQTFGAFADDPTFEEAMRLGRAYRESQRPTPDGRNDPGSR